MTVGTKRELSERQLIALAREYAVREPQDIDPTRNAGEPTLEQTLQRLAASYLDCVAPAPGAAGPSFQQAFKDGLARAWELMTPCGKARV